MSKCYRRSEQCITCKHLDECPSCRPIPTNPNVLAALEQDDYHDFVPRGQEIYLFSLKQLNAGMTDDPLYEAAFIRLENRVRRMERLVVLHCPSLVINNAFDLICEALNQLEELR